MTKSFYQDDKPLSNSRAGENKKNLNLILNETVKILDPVIRELLFSGVSEKNKELVSYQAFTGGKRIRPALSILSCLLAGGKIDDVLYPAASLEILHNYSLIIDDLVDNSDWRRKQPTLWAKYGRSITQCIAVDYPAAVFQGAYRSKDSARISEIFIKTMKTGVEVEILDLLFDQSNRKDEPYLTKNRYSEITDSDYLDMVGKKTAVLFKACCEVGGICAGAKEEELEALRQYGLNLGIAFQIRDDILDIFGKEEFFSKKIGKDISSGKLGNIVILLAFKELSPADKKKFLGIIKKENITKDDIKEAVQLIEKTTSRRKASKLGRTFITKAQESLKLLPKNRWNNTLETIADFVIEREE